MAMNYTDRTQELTASLQELTARRQSGQAGERELIPNTVDEGELVLSTEVSSFLENRSLYATKTERTSVGNY